MKVNIVHIHFLVYLAMLCQLLSLYITNETMGARGSVMVKALCYKPVGREFDTR
jgi:hypothetical protein